MVEASRTDMVKHSQQSGRQFGRLSKAVSPVGKRAQAKGVHQQAQKRHGGQRQKRGRKNKLAGGSLLQQEEMDTDEAGSAEEDADVDNTEEDADLPEDPSEAAPMAFVELESKDMSKPRASRHLSDRESIHRAQQHSQRTTLRQKRLKKMEQEQLREQRLQREQWLEQSVQRQQRWVASDKGKFVKVEGASDDGMFMEMRRWPVRFTRDSERTFLVDKCWTSWECNESAVPADTVASQIHTIAPGVVQQAGGSWMFFGAATTICTVVLGAVLRYKQLTGKFRSFMKSKILRED